MCLAVVASVVWFLALVIVGCVGLDFILLRCICWLICLLDCCFCFGVPCLGFCIAGWFLCLWVLIVYFGLTLCVWLIASDFVAFVGGFAVFVCCFVFSCFDLGVLLFGARLGCGCLLVWLLWLMLTCYLIVIWLIYVLLSFVLVTIKWFEFYNFVGCFKVLTL